eukprot:TRINITY_DN29312_c0_g1_i1.p1 TRINITY_DN29312_c0_g1~~TRINITY_DN29312_c0_g1_i1.p1  ORF type:complete len:919 (-),score=201.15 TRINITY_DN29312_c0_g1_i1:93-2801(-)
MASDPRLAEQLLTACGKGLLELVRLLLEKGVSLNCTRKDGWTPLMAACSAGHVSVAETLLERSATIDATAPDGFTALMEACTGGHKEVVSLLLEKGAGASMTTPSGSTPVVLASIHGHAPIVELLLKRGEDAMAPEQNGFSALRAACGNGQASVVSLLLSHSCLLPESSEATEALASACANGHLNVARLLLEHGISPAAAAADGDTALMKACMGSHREVAAELIFRGASVSDALETARKRKLPGVTRVLNRAKSEALKAAGPPAAEARDLETLVRDIESSSCAAPQRVRASSDAGSVVGSSATITVEDRASLTSPEQAISAPASSAPQTALASSQVLAPETMDTTAAAQPIASNSTGGSGGTDDSQAVRLADQLLLACCRGTCELVSLLLAKQANPNMPRQSDLWTPIMAACSNGHGEVAKQLLQARADFRAVARDGYSAVLEACANGHHDVVQLLLNHGATTADILEDGTSPLLLASLHGHVDTARLLLDRGANLSQGRHGEFTPMLAACGNGHANVAELLMQHGASLEGQSGAALLVSACANGHLAVVRLLLEHGVPATACSNDGTSALMKACLAAHREVAKVLVDHGADIEKVLDEAKRQNSLSGVRRVLSNVKPRLEGKLEETRDLETLVREIEGPKSSAAVAAPKQGKVRKRKPFVRDVWGPLRRGASKTPAVPVEAEDDLADDEVDTDEEEGEEDESGQQTKEVEQVHEQAEEQNVHQAEQRAEVPWGDVVERTAGRFPAGSTAARLASLGGDWSVRRLPISARAPGSFYTVEVFCQEESPSPSVSLTSGCGSMHCQQHGCRNRAVVAGRCQGWPAAELSLIPLSATELAELSLLAQGGLSARHQFASSPSPSGSTPGSAPSSLPDRDAPEEYAAWCAEASRRCVDKGNDERVAAC